MINLYINERRTGDVTILDLKGRLRVGGNTVALHRSIRSLIVEKKTRILLNLASVAFIDSCGLGELVASQVSLRNKGGEIRLTGVTDALCELLTVTGLLTVFDVCENEAAAMQKFADDVSKTGKPLLAFA